MHLLSNISELYTPYWMHNIDLIAFLGFFYFCVKSLFNILQWVKIAGFVYLYWVWTSLDLLHIVLTFFARCRPTLKRHKQHLLMNVMEKASWRLPDRVSQWCMFCQTYLFGFKLHGLSLCSAGAIIHMFALLLELFTSNNLLLKEWIFFSQFYAFF